MALSILAIFFAGVSIGMNVWSISIALKWLVWKKRDDSSDGGNNPSNGS